MADIVGSPTAKDLCRLYAENFGKLNGHPMTETWILDYGREFEFRPRPAAVEEGPPKNCFQNAMRLADEFNYVEGFVTLPTIPLLIHHAWNVDDDGYVVDATLNDPQNSYFGVEIPDVSSVEEIVGSTYSYSILHKLPGRELVESLD